MVNEGKIHNLSNKTTIQVRSKPDKDIRRKLQTGIYHEYRLKCLKNT